MNIDMAGLLTEIGVDFTSSRNWLSMNCPNCQDDEGHLGWNVEKNYFHCFRCGFFKTVELIATLTGEETSVCWTRILKFKTDFPVYIPHKKEERCAEKCVLPPGTGPMTAQHKNYLRKRGFNPEELERTWGVQGTCNLGEWKFRIIFPIYFKGELIGYQGRDWTGKAKLKYKTAQNKDCKIPIKHVLYGYDKAILNRVILVEGVMDVWRLGPGAVGAFGTELTAAQMCLLSQYDQVGIMFDGGEPHTLEKANKIARELSMMGTPAGVLELESGDPSDLTQIEADVIMNAWLMKGKV